MGEGSIDMRRVLGCGCGSGSGSAEEDADANGVGRRRWLRGAWALRRCGVPGRLWSQVEYEPVVMPCPTWCRVSGVPERTADNRSESMPVSRRDGLAFAEGLLSSAISESRKARSDWWTV